MKHIYKILVTAITVVLVSMSNAYGAVTVTINLNLTLNGGVDTNGFVGSTWEFTYLLSDPTYSDYFSYAAVLTESASVKISGAGNSDYNGEFTIIESSTTDFLFWPNALGTAYLSHNPTTGSESSFSIGIAPNTLAVVSLSLTGPSTASASIGGPVEASHFDGLVVSDGGVTVGATVYAFNNGTVTATAIPEPSTLPLVLFSAGIVLFSRKRGNVSR